MWGRQGLPLVVQHAHYGPGIDAIQNQAEFTTMNFAPDLPRTDQEGGGPHHKADVAGTAGRPP